MKLLEIKIKNFRCYKDETVVKINDLTCFIGKNDHGKSTILECLNAFFNDTIDKSDISVDSDSDTVEITCTFTNIPNQIILDASVETSPKDEGILNSDNNLEIKKIYKIGSAITKGTYIIGLHPDHNQILDILTLKNSPLKSLAEVLGVNLDGINKRHNPPIRKAIRDSLNAKRRLMAIKVDGNLDTENNLKKVWSQLKSFLPIYSLFKVDKTIDDKDKDVQDPMKIAIKEALAVPEIKELLDKIENEVKAKSTAVAEKTLEKLKEIDASLAEKMKSDFNKLPSWDRIFELTLLNENNIPLNKRGSGVKRLVLLSFFQAQAEKRKNEEDAPSIIYAIEEPETSQHPDHQKILIKSLIELSENDNVQVLFTTHSSNLAREIPIEALTFIYKNKGITHIEYGFNETTGKINEETLSKIISSLGVLPNPNDKIRVLLFVEGNHDINALIKYSKIFNEFNTDYINLENNAEIGIVISGGSSLKFYIDNKYLDGLGKPQVHIYDNDVTEYREYVAKINGENNVSKIAFNTSKNELENYLTKEAIEEAYSQNGTSITMLDITDDMDVPAIVAQILHKKNSDIEWEDLTSEEKKKKESRVKRLLNTQAVDKMTVERLKERNGFEDIEKWLNAIRDIK